MIFPDGELNLSLRYTLLDIFKTAKVVLCKLGRCVTEPMEGKWMHLSQDHVTVIPRIRMDDYAKRGE